MPSPELSPDFTMPERLPNPAEEIRHKELMKVVIEAQLKQAMQGLQAESVPLEKNNGS